MEHRKHEGAEYGRKPRVGQERLSIDEGKHHSGQPTQRAWRPKAAPKQSDQGGRIRGGAAE